MVTTSQRLPASLVTRIRAARAGQPWTETVRDALEAMLDDPGKRNTKDLDIAQDTAVD